MNAPRRSFRLKLIASAIIATLFLLLAEAMSALALNVFFPGSLSKKEEQLAHPAVWLARDEKKPKAKDWFRYRVVCIGDSCTYGIGLKPLEAYPAQLQELLNEKSGVEFQKFEVLNLGISGYSSEMGLRQLRALALDFKPDLVIASFGLNDKWRSEMTDHEKNEWQQSIFVQGRYRLMEFLDYSYSARLMHLLLEPLIKVRQTRFANLSVDYRVPLDQYRENLRLLARETRAAGAQIIFFSMAENPAIARLAQDGISAYEQGNYKLADELLSRCTKIDFMYYPRPYYYLSLAAQALGDAKKARANMAMARQAAAVFPFPRRISLPLDQIQVQSYLDGIKLEPDGFFDIYARYRQTIREVAGSENVPYLDMTGRDLHAGEFTDYCHLLRPGYAKVARHVAELIEREVLPRQKNETEHP